MDRSANALIIPISYVSKNNLITMKPSTNQWSTIAGSFSVSREASITQKMSELYVTAHISERFQVTTKKSNYNAILVEIYFGN